jgi:GntR family transcriptional regulator
MDIVLSPSSGKPIYLQIYEWISTQILSGKIAPGTRLPPIRAVALNLRISVIPVKQAWEQLEREGFITTSAGRGTSVAPLAIHEIRTKRSDTAVGILVRDIEACMAIGLSREEIAEIVNKAYERNTVPPAEGS